MDKLLVGLMGKPRAGKDFFCRVLLEEIPPSVVRVVCSGDLLRKVLELCALPTDRSYTQKLYLAMKATFGEEFVARALERQIASTRKSVIVYNAVRTMSDVEMVRSFSSHVFVDIYAGIQVRYRRDSIARQDLGQKPLPYELFLEQDTVITETELDTFRFESARRIVTIPNEDGREDFRSLVRLFVDQKVKPLLVQP